MKVHGGVGIVHYSAPPVVGGVETILRNQAAFLADCGIPVRVIAGTGGEVAPGVETVYIPELSSNHPGYRDLSGERFQREANRLRKKLAEAAAGLGSLIVHNLLTMPFNLVATAALRMLAEEGSKRVIAWCHDSPYFDPAYRIPRGEFPFTLISTPAPGVRYVTITEHRRQQFARLLGLPEEEIEVVRNGIDLSHFLSLAPQAAALVEEFSLYDKDLNVISPVRVTPRKNLEMAIRICHALRYYYPDLLLIITGYIDPHNAEAGAYFERLKGLVGELGMEGHVLFLGEYRMADGTPTVADWKATRDIYSLADVLMLTSYAEGFGLPLLEVGALTHAHRVLRHPHRAGDNRRHTECHSGGSRGGPPGGGGTHTRVLGQPRHLPAFQARLPRISLEGHREEQVPPPVGDRPQSPHRRLTH